MDQYQFLIAFKKRKLHKHCCQTYAFKKFVDVTFCQLSIVKKILKINDFLKRKGKAHIIWL